MNSDEKSDTRKIIVGLLSVSLLAVMIYFISSYGCRLNKESYKEYTGLPNMSNYSYKSYADTPDEKKKEKDRCTFCKGYNNYSYEAFENVQNDQNDFKLCPHNCREYGVALCNSQGKIM